MGRRGGHDPGAVGPGGGMGMPGQGTRGTQVAELRLGRALGAEGLGQARPEAPTHIEAPFVPPM